MIIEDELGWEVVGFGLVYEYRICMKERHMWFFGVFLISIANGVW